MHETYSSVNQLFFSLQDIPLGSVQEGSFFHLDVDTVQVPLTVFWHYTRFSGSLSSLDITNGNRSHNKPLELIETI